MSPLCFAMPCGLLPRSQGLSVLNPGSPWRGSLLGSGCLHPPWLWGFCGPQCHAGDVAGVPGNGDTQKIVLCLDDERRPTFRRGFRDEYRRKSVLHWLWKQRNVLTSVCRQFRLNERMWAVENCLICHSSFCPTYYLHPHPVPHFKCFYPHQSPCLHKITQLSTTWISYSAILPPYYSMFGHCHYTVLFIFLFIRPSSVSKFPKYLNWCTCSNCGPLQRMFLCRPIVLNIASHWSSWH